MTVPFFLAQAKSGDENCEQDIRPKRPAQWPEKRGQTQEAEEPFSYGGFHRDMTIGEMLVGGRDGPKSFPVRTQQVRPTRVRGLVSIRPLAVNVRNARITVLV